MPDVEADAWVDHLKTLFPIAAGAERILRAEAAAYVLSLRAEFDRLHNERADMIADNAKLRSERDAALADASRLYAKVKRLEAGE